MTTLGAKFLDFGEDFPDLTVNLVGGDTARLPDFLGPDYGLLLVYRGHW